MKKSRFLFLCGCFVATGCSTDMRSHEGSSLAKPAPRLVKYDDGGELLGFSGIEVREGSSLKLSFSAENESERLAVAIDWTAKWTGSVDALPSEMELGTELGSATLTIGDVEQPSKAGIIHAALADGVVTGDFDIDFAGQKRIGTFSGKPSLVCMPLNDGEAQGAGNSDGTPLSQWRSDPNLKSDFCREVQSAFGL